jgi:peptide deformylase
MKRKIKVFDASLREFSEPVSLAEVEGIKRKESDLYDLIQEMKAILLELGVGIAAIQLGVAKQILLIQPFKEKEPIVCINPELLRVHNVASFHYEGCISLPGIYEFVARPDECIIRFIDEEGIEQTSTMIGIESGVFLHEYDHLNGVVFVDRAFNRSQRRLFERKYHFLVHGKVGYEYEAN